MRFLVPIPVTIQYKTQLLDILRQNFILTFFHQKKKTLSNGKSCNRQKQMTVTDLHPTLLLNKRTHQLSTILGNNNNNNSKN